MTVELVVLDMAGTTVTDDGLVEQAFTAAIATGGVSEEDSRYPEMLDYVVDTMGESKISVFRTCLPRKPRRSGPTLPSRRPTASSSVNARRSRVPKTSSAACGRAASRSP